MGLKIDKKCTALLVLDLQKYIMHEESPLASFVPFASMVKETKLLPKVHSVIKAVRDAGMPVVFIRVDHSKGEFPRYPQRGYFCQMLAREAASGEVMRPGSWGYDLHEDVKPKSGEPLFTKRFLSAFSGSNDLENYLECNGITDIVLSGVATTFVVTGTAWVGVEKGYSCVILKDCCTAASAELHEAALTILNPISDVVSSDEFIAAIS